MYKRPERNKIWIVIVITATIVFIFYSTQNGNDSGISSSKDSYTEVIPSPKTGASWAAHHRKSESGKYLINTTYCRIPDIDPFGEDIRQFVHKEEYTRCTDKGLLTYIEKRFGSVTLNINATLLHQYSYFQVTCCYSEIHRVMGDDNQIRFTPCNYFKASIVIQHPFVKVVCRNIFFKKVYENVHATTLSSDVPHREDLRDPSFFSVLLVGIDSMSKQNLRRTMPKCYRYLEGQFTKLNGYNKIGDNTYPNLMAILTGQNTSQLWKSCPFSINNGHRNRNKNPFSRCYLVWKQFSRLGYVTAFGEDACPLSTFNYYKVGFPDTPTDYYYRPYFLAAEQLKTVASKCHNRFCSGPENTGERILNIAKDFSITLQNHSTFGLFWTNTFSHDNINCPSAMDDKVLKFLSDPDFIDSLDNTIFIFFSDHGYRFGDIRHSISGWLEDRLPFIYLRVPMEFQKRFPVEYENIQINSHRLTSPYDLYNTLQHVLTLSNASYEPLKSLGCLECQSIFKEINENRTCKAASISQEWCTCINYQPLPVTDPIVENLAPLVVETVNNVVQNFLERSRCAIYRFKSVVAASKSEECVNEDNKKVNYILIMVNTKPTAIFGVALEVPVEFYRRFKVMGDISRLDRYEDNSYCVNNAELKKYCHCR